jgi:hypothetical protein
MQERPRLGATAMIMTQSTMGETDYKERKFTDIQLALLLHWYGHMTNPVARSVLPSNDYHQLVCMLWLGEQCASTGMGSSAASGGFVRVPLLTKVGRPSGSRVWVGGIRIILCKEVKLVGLLLKIRWNKYQNIRLLGYYNLDS